MSNKLVSTNSKSKPKVMAFKSNGEAIAVDNLVLKPEEGFVKRELGTGYSSYKLAKLIEGLRDVVKQALIEIENLIKVLDLIQGLDEKLAVQNIDQANNLPQPDKGGLLNLLQSPAINNLLQSPEILKLIQSPEINNLVGSLFSSKSE